MHPSTVTQEVIPNIHKVPYSIKGHTQLYEIIVKLEPSICPTIPFLTRWLRQATGCEVTVYIPTPLMAFPVCVKD